MTNRLSLLIAIVGAAAALGAADAPASSPDGAGFRWSHDPQAVGRWGHDIEVVGRWGRPGRALPLRTAR